MTETEFSPCCTALEKIQLTKGDQYNNVDRNEVYINIILQQEQTAGPGFQKQQ